jgi:hypothetical protein
MGLHAMVLVSLESKGEPTWFETDEDMHICGISKLIGNCLSYPST